MAITKKGREIIQEKGIKVAQEQGFEGKL